MAIYANVEVATVEVGDAYDVTLWQHRKLTSYTPEEARELAGDLIEAAASAEHMLLEDNADLRARLTTSTITTPTGETVL